MYARQQRVHGRPLVPTLLWGRVPALLLRFLAMGAGFNRRGSPLDPVLQALICVRVSQLNWCAFCVDFNAGRVLKRGAHERKLAELSSFRDSAEFTDAEKAALEYAEAVTRSDVQVDDGLFARLREHYSEDAVVELTGLIAFQNMSSKFNAALDVDPQGFCRLPL